VSISIEEATGIGWNDQAVLGRGWTSWRAVCKRAIDIGAACTGLVLLSPVAVAVALTIWVLDGGPVLFRHTRIGQGGVSFRCLKFRTMVQDAEERLETLLAQSPAARAEWNATQKLQIDPRVLGRLGQILRSTSIDEIPQLWNVLRGEMSLVGPRPIVREELPHYDVMAVWYLSVRPGMTGPWQIGGRSDASYAARVRLDVAYARQPSLRNDIGILMRTFLAVLGRRGAC
jgi:exopolysaccharide production protein ExoY